MKLVIIIVAYWGSLNREIYVRLGKNIGFETVDVISEPVAAAVYSHMDMKKDNKAIMEDGAEEMVMTVDIGGGTTDLTIMQIKYKNGN